jgi:acetoin utilization protein AcuC
MFESESLKGGSTLDGARLLAAGECDVAFSFAGGMHHAGPAEASGFCVFNDAAIALRWLAQEGLRAAYIDVDVHHGDGVQWAFFESADVLTISLHQDGRTLFPGTGAVEECGKGKGEGFCINVPLPPGTDDELYLWAFDQVVPRAVRRFAPDILVTQLGVDTHARDPLAELLLTTRGHTAIFERLDRLASRWLALGGGGYDLDVVPRSWALAVGVMARLDLPDALPAAYREKYGGDRLRDREEPRRPDEERSLLRETVERTVRRVLELHGLSGSAREGGMPGK